MSSVGGGPGQVTIKSTVSATALTLDPQLLFIPAPHVGITLGLVFDAGVDGSTETSGDIAAASVKSDFSASAYGATAGLALVL